MALRKLFAAEQASITGAAIILGAASLLSRIAGIIRDRIFAHLFGAGPTLDAYYAAFRIPDLMYNLIIVGAVSAGFIPIFTALRKKNADEAWTMTSSLINILGISLLCICAILYFATPAILPRLTPGFDQETLTMAIRLTRWMYISPIILGLSSIVSGVLQSYKDFFIYSLAPIMYNVGIIAGALFLVPFFGADGLAFGVILGTVLHLGIQLPALARRGFRYRPTLLFRQKELRDVSVLMIPRTLGLATTQLTLLAITNLASTLAAGSVAIFNFATNIQHVPLGMAALPFAIAAFPSLAEAGAEKNNQELARITVRTGRQILFLILPLSVLFLLLRAQIVRVILGSGAFNWEDTIITADTLAFFILSLFAQALIPLVVRTFFALKDTWTPFIAGIAGTCVTILSGLFLKEELGIPGLALSFSLGAAVQLAVLWVLLRKKIGRLEDQSLLFFLYKITVAVSAMSLGVQLLKYPLASILDLTRFWGVLSQGFLAGSAGLILYAAICHFLQVDEMVSLKQVIERRLLKVRPVQAELTESDEV